MALSDVDIGRALKMREAAFPADEYEQPRKEIFFCSGYMTMCWSPEEIVRNLRASLADNPVEFDTMVGTGLSGALVIPALAVAFDVFPLIVRKEGDSSHAMQRLEGTLGLRWLFVDDFRDTGATEARVDEVLAKYVGWEHAFPSVKVGSYMYKSKQLILEKR
jgi:hypothetical protein